jgi:nucleoside-diphosphate-sugar epimerase
VGRVLIAGCGFVGVKLAAELAEQGQEVLALRRSAGKLTALLEVYPRVRELVTDVNSLRSRDLPRDISHVVYAASADQRTQAAYQSAYLGGLRRVLGLPQLAAAAFQRLIFISSSAVYHQNGGEWVDEHTATNPASFNGKLLLEAEQLALGSGCPATVLRCSGIYGPGRRRLLQMVQSGKARFDPQRPHYTNRIHRDDVAGACLHLIELARAGQPLPPVLLASDENPESLQQVLIWLAARLGAPAPQETSASSPPPTPTGKRCSSRLLRSLGYVFRYPSFREGYDRMIDAR